MYFTAAKPLTKIVYVIVSILPIKGKTVQIKTFVFTTSWEIHELHTL